MKVLPFPDGPPVASLQGANTFPPVTDFPSGSDSFSGFAEYVTRDLVLVSSAREGVRLVLSPDDLRRVGIVEHKSSCHGGPVATDGRGHFVTYDSARSLQLWALAAGDH
ncbi:hypothetical protein JY651_11625 [Pyxidicoccus parkwayensis]|uniref:Uncharacterized protein n=1 Tax=Pyxidicoccus parkwayensis TaxID=2813578 RepID=A0ABX7P4X5_9BACT|nr:hypothetical protein [Pyxidicoccus parkwaysis]QSQ25535.1 hypothetical protein JY651_11625 [Pyxidicoccus parkwaysis]